jgi:hypothetical protein
LAIAVIRGADREGSRFVVVVLLKTWRQVRARGNPRQATPGRSSVTPAASASPLSGDEPAEQLLWCRHEREDYDRLVRHAPSWPRTLIALTAGLLAGLLVWMPVGFLIWLRVIDPAVQDEQSQLDFGIFHFEGESSGTPFDAGTQATVGAAAFYAALLALIALGVWLAFRVIARARPRLLVVLAAIVAADLTGIELLGRVLPLAGLLLALALPVVVLRRETGQ